MQAAWPAAQTGGDPATRFAAARAAALGKATSAAADRPTGSTGFLATDAAGRAVGCAIGLGRPFGSGQTIEALGIFAAAPFDASTPLSLVPMLSTDGTGEQLLGMVVGSGSLAALADAAAVAAGVFAGKRPLGEAVADPRVPAELLGTLVADRVEALACPGGLPAQPGSCAVQHDPRGAGYSVNVDRLTR